MLLHHYLLHYVLQNCTKNIDLKTKLLKSYIIIQIQKKNTRLKTSKLILEDPNHKIAYLKLKQRFLGIRLLIRTISN